MSTELPEDLRPVLDNGVPVLFATCAADGTPNLSIVSDVTWVDARHVALSFQFFSKTIRNVRENPRAQLLINDHRRGRRWILDVTYVRSETEGPLFEAMELQIEAIASSSGMSGIFRLRSADVYRVLRIGTVDSAP